MGNAVTLGLELVAVLLALALVHRVGRRLPAAVVLVPVWLGTGLLAPVALALPLGIVAQAIAGGSPAPADNGLQGWVYAVVYGGFAVQAAALLTAFVLYARVRWAAVLRLRPANLAPATARTRVPTAAGAAGAVLYGAANLAWAVGGAPLAAPPDFDTVAQRSLLAGTGLLALAGASALLPLVRRRRLPHRVWVPLAVGWVGSASCFASGVAQYALAADASAEPATSLILALGSVSGLALAAAGIRAPGR